jgi:hypothetical protein
MHTHQRGVVSAALRLENPRRCNTGCHCPWPKTFCRCWFMYVPNSVYRRFLRRPNTMSKHRIRAGLGWPSPCLYDRLSLPFGQHLPLGQRLPPLVVQAAELPANRRFESSRSRLAFTSQTRYSPRALAAPCIPARAGIPSPRPRSCPSSEAACPPLPSPGPDCNAPASAWLP